MNLEIYLNARTPASGASTSVLLEITQRDRAMNIRSNRDLSFRRMKLHGSICHPRLDVSPHLADLRIAPPASFENAAFSRRRKFSPSRRSSHFRSERQLSNPKSLLFEIVLKSEVDTYAGVSERRKNVTCLLASTNALVEKSVVKIFPGDVARFTQRLPAKCNVKSACS